VKFKSPLLKKDWQEIFPAKFPEISIEWVEEKQNTSVLFKIQSERFFF
jgi:hypothetical protein